MIEDKICYYFAEGFKTMSANMGITYNQFTVYLFAFYLPITIIIFMFFSLYNYEHKTKWNKCVTILLIIFNVLFGLLFLGSVPF